MSSDAAPPTTPLDPRVTRSRAAVLDATASLLAEQGWSGTTIEAIAERSGVAKTTIYRHWPHRAGLILEAFASLGAVHEVAESGHLYADLVTMMCSLADDLDQSRWSRVLPALVEGAERDPELARLAATLGRERRRGLVHCLEAAVERGALPGDADVELMAHMLVDPLFFRRLVWRERTTTRFIESLVDHVLRAFGAA